MLNDNIIVLCNYQQPLTNFKCLTEYDINDKMKHAINQNQRSLQLFCYSVN
jgi:hypothetical protein